MEATIKVEKTVNLKTIDINVSDVYFEDFRVFTGGEWREGDEVKWCQIPYAGTDDWSPKIDIDEGRVIDWPLGVKLEIVSKVRDSFSWSIKDENGDIVLDSGGEGYVPDTFGDGDYLEMTINEKGKIESWHFRLDDFTSQEED